jgi:hypothetical protein
MPRWAINGSQNRRSDAASRSSRKSNPVRSWGKRCSPMGRFRQRDDAAEGRAMIERALGLFEEMDATGWIEEARAALDPH